MYARSSEILNHKNHTPIQWRGLGAWNYYFIIKFALLWYGYLNFHAFENLLFVAIIVFPLSHKISNKIRTVICLILGLGLFYHDTWLPNIYSVMSQGASVFQFSFSYILELLNRFINWNMIGTGFILLVFYLFINQWIRLTTLTILTLVWMNIAPKLPSLQIQFLTPSPTTKPAATPQTSTTTATNEPSSKLPATNENLNNYLTDFFNSQKPIQTQFPAALVADAQPFDLLIVHICSLAWADVNAAHLRDHPIWSKFDILFNNFNSAASYSGPAAIRLLRMTCGQTTHEKLYEAVPENCYLFNHLSNLGFSTDMMLDHPGKFGNFLQELQDYGDLAKTPMISQAGASPELIAFNGQMISNDAQMLNRWLDKVKTSKNTRTATYYNILAPHDGNHFLDNKQAPYKDIAQKLFDELDNFFLEIEKSGRKVAVLFIPEHGVNLTGDKLQMAGARDIPSPDITLVPVGFKFINMKTPAPANGPIQINEPSSYTAVAEIISRIADGKIFTDTKKSLQTLAVNLPQTAVVSQNEGITVMKYQGKYYIRLKGDNNWVPYPQ